MRGGAGGTAGGSTTRLPGRGVRIVIRRSLVPSVVVVIIVVVVGVVFGARRAASALLTQNAIQAIRPRRQFNVLCLEHAGEKFRLSLLRQGRRHSSVAEEVSAAAPTSLTTLATSTAAAAPTAPRGLRRRTVEQKVRRTARRIVVRPERSIA